MVDLGARRILATLACSGDAGDTTRQCLRSRYRPLEPLDLAPGPDNPAEAIADGYHAGDRKVPGGWPRWPVTDTERRACAQLSRSVFDPIVGPGLLRTQQQRLRILIVSDKDDAEIAKAFADKDRAVKLIHASSLAEARHAVATEHVDAVLVDFAVARTCGRDIRRQLAASSRRISVVVVLEDDAVVHVNEAIALGADGFYYKCQLYSRLFGGQDGAFAG